MINEILKFNKEFVANKGYEKFVTNKYPNKIHTPLLFVHGGKRIQWQNTIWAWFAKWLQYDPTWWNDIYSPKEV